MQLDAFNRERQDIERKITEDAERMIEELYIGDAGIVLFSEAWHPRRRRDRGGPGDEALQRPCIVLGNEGDMAKGSGRSVDGVNLVEILATCPAGLTSWGGHPMAVGVSLPKVELEGFRKRFASAVKAHVGAGIADAQLKIAAWLKPEQISEALMDELDALHPYGQGNPEPVFGPARRRAPQAARDLQDAALPVLAGGPRGAGRLTASPGRWRTAFRRLACRSTSPSS